MAQAISRNGRKLITIQVDGEATRPTEAWWVVYSPEDKPVKAFPSDTITGDNIARAARVAWYGDTAAILALNEGHRIELMSQKRFLKTVSQHLPE